MIYLLLFIASLIWGFNIIVMKLLLIDMPFIMLATLRVFISLISISIYMFIKHISFYYKDLIKVVVVSFFGVYLNFYLTFLAMSYLKGTQIVFINALSLTITCLLSLLFFKSKISIREWISIILTVSAFIISIHFDLSMLNTGFVFMIMGLVFYALSYICIKKMNIDFSLSFIFYQLLFGFVMLFIHALLTHQFDIDTITSLSIKNWILFILFSGVGFAYIQVIYFFAINKVGVYTTSLFLSLNPVVTYIGSLLVLNEESSFYYNVGVLFIIMSILFNFIYMKYRKS